MVYKPVAPPRQYSDLDHAIFTNLGIAVDVLPPEQETKTYCVGEKDVVFRTEAWIWRVPREQYDLHVGEFNRMALCHNLRQVSK